MFFWLVKSASFHMGRELQAAGTLSYEFLSLYGKAYSLCSIIINKFMKNSRQTTDAGKRRIHPRLLLIVIVCMQVFSFSVKRPHACIANRVIVQLIIFQQYFSANEQCFSLTTNQHKQQYKLNFSKTNKALGHDVQLIE